MSRKTLQVVSVSGGKDSLATLLIAIKRCGRESVRAIFCDTGNEHAYVYEYLDYLEEHLGIEIERLKANFNEQIMKKRMFIARDQRIGRDKKGRKIRWSNKAKRRALSALHPTGIPFLDLCLWKGRFPSRTAQFCTEELKRNIAVAYQIDLIDAGFNVISWQGVRRDESRNRANAKKTERVGRSLRVMRPVCEWSAQDVIEYCESCGVKHNPLYSEGMSRVGCMPCINCGKDEIRQIDARFREYLDERKRWEFLVSMASKRGFSTFFNKELHSENCSDRIIYQKNGIENVVKWAKTTRGGKQYDILALQIEPTACSSSYGLCE